MRHLSPRQKEVLDAIARLTKARGYPPTLREMGAALGIRSTNGVVDHLNRLTTLGYVVRDDMKSRGVRLIRAWPEGVGDAQPASEAGRIASPSAPGEPDEHVEPTGGAMELIQLPVVHSIPPDGRIDMESVLDVLTFPRRDFSPGPGLLFALRVKTAAMVAEGILPGDHLLCRMGAIQPNDALCLVSFADESCLRRVTLEPGGLRWRFQPPGTGTPYHLDARQFDPRQIVAVVERLWRALPSSTPAAARAPSPILHTPSPSAET